MGVVSLLAKLIPFTRYDFTGRRVDCPVCGSAEHETIARLDRRLKRLETSLCGNCGLFFSNPMPNPEELAAYYREQYRADYQFAFARPGAKHVAKKRAEAARRYATLAPHFRKTKVTFLDFGCGSGELVQKFAEMGHVARGFEPGDAYAEFGAGLARQAEAGRDITIDRGLWQELDYASGSFDVITALHVIEHLAEPIAALRKIEVWLAPEGIAFIEVPNLQGYALKGFEHFHFAHVLGFSRDNLILAAAKAGLVVEEIVSATGLILRKRREGEAEIPTPIDLAATVEKNAADYGAPFALLPYLAHHARRLWRRSLGRIFARGSSG